MMNADRLLQLLLSASLRGTLLLVIAWAATLIFKRSSASVRHWIISLALIATLAIPVIALTIPVWSVPILPENTSDNAIVALRQLNAALSLEPVQSTSQQAAATNKTRTNDSSTRSTPQQPAITAPATRQASARSATVPFAAISWAIVALLLWAVGGLTVLARWIVQTQHIWTITRRGKTFTEPICAQLVSQLKIRRCVQLVLSSEVTIPLTWGIWRPRIVLPIAARGWSSERREIVLLHELTHIARWDYLTQWLALLSCAINWFNPLVWKMARLLAEAREQACDDQVLAMGAKSSEYASSLLEISQAMRFAQPGVLAMAQSSNLGKRIYRILDSRQSRHSLTPTRSITMALLLAIAILPLSTMQLSRASAQNNAITISVALAPGMKDQFGDQLVKGFEDSHPGITVAFVDSPDVPDPVGGVNDYFTAVQKVANSADVVVTTSFGNLMSVVPEGTRAGYFLDLTPLINADTSFNVDDYYPQAWQSFQWDGGIWALPASLDLGVLSYDKSAFDKAGLAYPTGKWTVDDFANAVTKLTTKDSSGNVIRAGFANSGRIYRLGIWQSLFGDTKLYDDSAVPNQPQFDKPDVEKVVGTYGQLEHDGAIGGDAGSAAMIVDDIAHAAHDNYAAALLPGDKAELMAAGFAISAGTQHPDLAYALATYLTTQGLVAKALRLPARKSIDSGISQDSRLTAVSSLIDQGIANGMNFSEMRFTSYLNQAYYNGTGSEKAAVQAIETQAINDLKAADAKKGTLSLAVAEPVAPVLAAGKIALNFDLNADFDPSANKDQWDRVVQDFTANDPQVGMVNVRRVQDTLDHAAASTDCFYFPSNEVPMMTANEVLDLTPFLTTDTGYDASDFMGNVLAQVQRDNKTYALPVDIEPLVMQYVPDKFSAANVPAPTNKWTIEQFVDALKALKLNSQGQGPFVDAGSNGTYLLDLIADYGGLPLDYRTDPPTINFTDPATVTAIQQALDLAKNGLIRYGELGSLTSSADIGPTDTTAIYPIALNGFPGRKIAPGTQPDKAALFPMGHQFTGVSYSLGTLLISAQSQNPEACYRFISTIAKHPELFVSMPARRSLLDNADFKASTNPDTLALYNQVDALLKDSHTVAIPSLQKGDVSVSNFLLQHWLFEAFDAYILTGNDLPTALQTAEGYAKTFQGCTASLPALSLMSANDNANDTTKAYVDCAEKTDNRLKPILDPLVNH